MLKFVKRVLVFIIAFGIIIAIQSRDDIYASEVNTDNETIMEAIEELRFYSSYNYQTLTEDKLSQLIVDFYLPVRYGDVLIDWQLESEYVELGTETETIEINSITGYVEVEVLKVTILEVPSVFKGDQVFELLASFEYLDESVEYSYFGTLVPQISADFLGGATYTLIRYFSLFVEGALLTIGISLVGTVIGFVLALFIVTGKTLNIKDFESKASKITKQVIKKVSSLYVIIFRGTPMIVQASFFWFGLGLFGNALLCGLFVVSLNTAAYIAEIIRGGIQSVDSGQTEASKSLGMTGSQTMRYIIFPQAIKNSLPAIGNEFVINIKDTAVLSVIGIFELFNQTRKIAGMHYRQLEAYLIVALIYLFLTYTVSSILRQVEKRLDMPLKELPSSN
ncbi:MAG: amino acid ABC transporter permease [Tenericutes bacterium]|nr:amino acid ABC transporter permease [Mycoplasmatota bacterium]